jgi:arylsulfatase A-like enzyme
VKLPAGRRGGEATDGQVRGIDVAPTILAALGLPAPPAFEGRDLLASAPATARGGDSVSARDVVDPNVSIALRTEAWKLYDARLFDLSHDAPETRDVSKDHPDVRRDMKQRLTEALAARPNPSPRPAKPDDELLEKLRSLGYVQ